MKKKIIIDTEVYKDYFLLSAMEVDTGRIINIEMYEGHPLDVERVNDLMRKYITIGFNSNKFDIPMIAAAVDGYDNDKLKGLCDSIIGSNAPVWSIYITNNLNMQGDWNTIDLIEVAPGMVSLKIYGGRLNAPTIQDLPIDPDASISPEQREELRTYCKNDLETTKLLYDSLLPQIALRESMTAKYGIDLRSKSDAQIAEAVLASELRKITKKELKRPNVKPTDTFRYLDPEIIRFKTEQLDTILQRVVDQKFTLGLNGALTLPDWLKKEVIVINGRKYQMGIGGLHSCEKSQYINAPDDWFLQDRDVVSYYPSIILQQQVAPKNMGKPFLELYQGIVTERIAAKKQGDNVVANTLKIFLNGSFGKLGSKYSLLYAPDLLLQTTITGQLALLMLIERMEDVGIQIVSANTDGIVCYAPKSLIHECNAVAFEWELDTSYQLETTDYVKLASRDVNNYLAVKTDGKVKGKGVFASTGLAKNPDGSIVKTAVALCVAKNIPVEKTIKECQDITQFVTVRRVTGGAVWQDEYLGKAVRFYYSTEVPKDTCIHYAKNSNRVPMSGGGKPLMTLPDTFPSDVDYQVYVQMAHDLLKEVGHA
jgi:DNA polymerase elongation subunit (family B)